MKGVSGATYRGLMGLIKGHNDIDMRVTAKRQRERQRERQRRGEKARTTLRY